MENSPAKVLEIAEQIKPLLAGRGPVLQSAVLAELLSIVLASHWIPGERAHTESLRKTILEIHCRLVWELVEVNSKTMGTDGDSP
jgi:hypothetical protein